jgi:hypothetical protein
MVTIDSRPRPVRALHYVFRGAGSEEAARGTLTAAPAVAEPARLVVIAVDENTVSRGREKAVASAAWRVIDSLTPTDLVGVMALPRPRGRTSLATDREPLRAALHALAGRASSDRTPVEAAGPAPFRTDPPVPGDRSGGERGQGQQQTMPEPRPDPAAPDAASPATTGAPGATPSGTAARRDARDTGEDSLRTLSQVINELRAVPGRKFVVYVSGGEGDPGVGEGVWTVTDPRELVDAAALARASVHVVLVPSHDRLQSDPRLERLALDTGGTVSTVRAKRADIGALVGALSSGYLVELEDLPTSPAAGRAVTLTVRTPRRNVRLIAAARWSARDDPLPPPPPAPAPPPAAGSTAPTTASGRKPAPVPAPDTDLRPVIARVGRYVDTYLSELGSVVCEESYLQILRRGTAVVDSRRTRSDLLLLRGRDEWIAFRDVFEVNGRPVRDREERLKKLFLENPGEALSEGRRISEESARYNLGAVFRTINTPVLALSFFQSAFLPTFRFERHGTDTIDGVVLWRIDYQEVGSPTQVAQAVTGEDRPSSGSIWVEPASGRIVRTVLKNGDAGMLVEVSVRYRPDDAVGLWMPAQMEERYYAPAMRRESIATEASYSAFRRFQVDTAESLGPPK